MIPFQNTAVCCPLQSQQMTVVCTWPLCTLTICGNSFGISSMMDFHKSLHRSTKMARACMVVPSLPPIGDLPPTIHPIARLAVGCPLHFQPPDLTTQHVDLGARKSYPGGQCQPFYSNLAPFTSLPPWLPKP